MIFSFNNYFIPDSGLGVGLIPDDRNAGGIQLYHFNTGNFIATGFVYTLINADWNPVTCSGN